MAVEWIKTEGRVFSFAANPTYLAGYVVLLLPLLWAVGAMKSAEEVEAVAAASWRTRIVAGTLVLLAASALIFDRYFEGQPTYFMIFATAAIAAILAAAIFGQAQREVDAASSPGRRVAYWVLILLLGASCSCL